MPQHRILSLVPTSRPVGFAYFEGPQLIDWGVHGQRFPGRATGRAKRVVDDLVRRCDPEIVLLPSTEVDARRPFHKEIVAAIRKSPVELGFATRRDVDRCFEEFLRPQRPTKHRVRVVLAEYFPELSPVVPRPRKPWQARDYWAPMFDAVAQAFAWKMRHQ